MGLLIIALAGCSRERLSLYLEITVDEDGHWLTAHFQNTGTREIKIWESGFWPNTLVACRDESGESPPLTSEGKRLLKAFHPGGERAKNVLVKLKPLQVHRGVPVLLERVFVLDPSKTYFVHLVYEEKAEGAWVGRIKSNTVRLMPHEVGRGDVFRGILNGGALVGIPPAGNTLRVSTTEVLPSAFVKRRRADL